MRFDFDIEPPRRCPRHDDEPSPYPCGACIEAADWHREWTKGKTLFDAEAASLKARTQADLTRAEIDRCGLCGPDGYVGPSVCRHDPHAPARAVRGAALARDALASALAASPEGHE